MEKDTPWGKHEITGPKHLYRQRLLFNLLKRYANTDSKILDVGCGSGSLLLRMAKAEYHAIGRDLSNDFIENIREKVKDDKDIERLDIGVASVDALDISTDSVDVVIMSEILEHLSDEKPALREAGRVLKKNGLLLISVPAHPGMWSAVDEFAGHFRRYTSVQLRSILKEAGFEIIQFRSWGFPVTRCYEKLLFKPWMKRREQRGEKPGAGGMLGKLAGLSYISNPLSWLLSIDEIFSSLPFGIGWITISRVTSEGKRTD